MCLDPLTAVAIGLTAGGQLIKGSEDAANTRRMIKARNAATEAELARQKGFQQITGGIFDESVNQFMPGAQADRLAGGQEAANELFLGNSPTAHDVGTIGPRTASDYVKGREAATVADAFTENMTRSGALADLTGWDNYSFDNKAGLNAAGLDLGVYGDLSANSARVSGLEQQTAFNNAWRQPSGLGDLLTFAGNVAGFGAGGGMTPFSMAAKSPIAASMIRPTPSFSMSGWLP